MGHGGKRLGLLREALRYPEEVEFDLMVLGIDFRDFFLPGGGPSRLTARRLAVCLQNLDMYTSRFYAKKHDLDPLSTETRILADVFGMFAQEQHPIVAWREIVAKQRAFEEKKARILANDRRRSV